MDTNTSPDKAALVTVLNYLRNKKLKDTEEALRKELTVMAGSELSDPQNSIEVSSLGGTEPSKYEDSYLGLPMSPAPSTNTETELQSDMSPETSLTLLHSTTQETEPDDLDHIDSESPLETSSRKLPPNLLDFRTLRPAGVSLAQASPTDSLLSAQDNGQLLTKSLPRIAMGSPVLYQVGVPGAQAMGRQIITPILTVLPNSSILNPVTAATLQAGGQQIVFSNTPASVANPRPRSSSDTSVSRPISPLDQARPGCSPPRTLASLMLSEMTPQYMELKAFAEEFKTKRIRLGFTQGAVGQSLARKGYNNFAQSTISRFEQMQLSPANAAAIKQVLEKWLQEAECPESVSVTSSTPVGPIMSCRKRKKRAVFTAQTRINLDEYFRQNPRPNRQLIENIADELGLLPEEVRVWFCNKRQKNKPGTDRESSVSTSSFIDSPPSMFESKNTRSPSPKTPFTIEELSKSSASTTYSPASVTSPMQLSTLGLVRPLSAPGLVPMMFNIGRRSPPALLPSPPFVAQTRA